MQNTVAEYIHVGESSTTDFDALTHALERLLIRHQSILKAEGVDRQVENLKDWLEEHRKDFATAGVVSETGNAWLADLRDSLKLAVEERQRLESEGGLSATKEQAEQNEELLTAIRRIEKIMNTDSVRR